MLIQTSSQLTQAAVNVQSISISIECQDNNKKHIHHQIVSIVVLLVKIVLEIWWLEWLFSVAVSNRHWSINFIFIHYFFLLVLWEWMKLTYLFLGTGKFIVLSSFIWFWGINFLPYVCR